ncbi:MAG: diacylglycerol kinase [Rhizobiaceae bacterium]
MKRWLAAFANSGRAFAHLFRHETAFREEAIAVGLSVPAAWMISGTTGGMLLLVAMALLVLLVETLNTGIEKACDTITTEFHETIRIAKDCGSLAVLISLVIAGGAWAWALWRFFAGAAI